MPRPGASYRRRSGLVLASESYRQSGLLPIATRPMTRGGESMQVSTPRRAALGALALVALGLALAGCGGGSKAATSYAAAPTQSCLEGAGASVDASGWDYISKTAAGGSYSATVDGKLVILGFFHSPNDAKQALSAYSAAAPGGSFYRLGNATLSWDDSPTAADRGVVADCLTR
jgi:hypothetical protein